mmetsp:Transcript_28867/g.85274  ORF Transcript_28867/g.85274 Transcript_28867/m.85274 type:complete len:451 (+) Transcript_28867:710-2062(+)
MSRIEQLVRPLDHRVGVLPPPAPVRIEILLQRHLHRRGRPLGPLSRYRQSHSLPCVLDRRSRHAPPFLHERLEIVAVVVTHVPVGDPHAGDRDEIPSPFRRGGGVVQPQRPQRREEEGPSHVRGRISDVVQCMSPHIPSGRIGSALGQHPIFRPRTGNRGSRSERQYEQHPMRTVSIRMGRPSMIRLLIHQQRAPRFPRSEPSRLPSRGGKSQIGTEVLGAAVAADVSAGTHLRGSHASGGILKSHEQAERRKERPSVPERIPLGESILVPELIGRPVRRRDGRHLDDRGIRTGEDLQRRTEDRMGRDFVQRARYRGMFGRPYPERPSIFVRDDVYAVPLLQSGVSTEDEIAECRGGPSGQDVGIDRRPVDHHPIRPFPRGHVLVHEQFVRVRRRDVLGDAMTIVVRVFLDRVPSVAPLLPIFLGGPFHHFHLRNEIVVVNRPQEGRRRR